MQSFQLIMASLYMRIINSVVVVGLYYGFMSTFSSIGLSYLLLLQAHIEAIEEGEKESKKEVSAATGFLVGQLLIFVSIYYTPLHLALGGPHTITFLVPSFLLLFDRYNSENLSQPTGQTLMHNPSTQSIFLINLLFPLLNHFFLPSSMLARLVNIYTFFYKNKMLFVTGSFVGWLIGQILLIKWVRFVLVWLQKNYLIRAKRYIFSNEYLFYGFQFYQNVMFDLRKYMRRFGSILVFFTCLCTLCCTFGRMPLPSPSPLLTFQMKAETQEKKAISRFKKELENMKIEKKINFKYDPFLNGPYRGILREMCIPALQEKAESLQNRKNPGVFFYGKKLPIYFDQKTDRFSKRSLLYYVHYFLAVFRNQSIVSQFLGKDDKYRKEILKQVPRWPYRLVYETEEAEQQEPEKQQKRKKEKEPEGHIRDIPIRGTVHYLRKDKWDVVRITSQTHEHSNEHSDYILDRTFKKFVHFCYVIKGIFQKYLRKISEVEPSDYYPSFADLFSISIEESGEEESGIDDKNKLDKKSQKMRKDYAKWIFLILERLCKILSKINGR